MPRVILHAADHRITAQCAGKDLSLSFQRPAGGIIQPGNYTLSAPVRDSAYGTFAVLIPRKKPGASATYGSYEDSNHQNYVQSSGATGKPCRVFGGAAAIPKNLEGYTRSSNAEIKQDASDQDQSSVIVISTRQLPGRDVLVIRQGFFDLMSALSVTGGAEVQVI